MTSPTAYQATLANMEHDLYGSTRFPITVDLGPNTYQFYIWRGQQLPDRLLAYDVETRPIDKLEIPEVALAAVYGDHGSCCFVHPADLPAFIRNHAGAYFVGHNVVFDFWTTAQAIARDPAAVAAWWEIAGSGRMICTMLLDSLIRLAEIDAEPTGRDLGTAAADYCGLLVDKQDPFRMRYAELCGLSAEQWTDQEPGFFQYAAKDPIATLLVAQRQFEISKFHHGHGRLLPGARRKFGPLTVCLQVQGAIVLDYIYRTGVHVDLCQVQQLRDSVCALVEERQQRLEQLLPGCFKRHGPRCRRAGQLQRTDSGVPRKNAKVIKQHLESIANQASEIIQPPRNKDGLVTDSAKYWNQYGHLDPFIGAYVGYTEQATLAKFFKSLDQPVIHPRYRTLVRSGRTSCSSPNLQQLPRDTRFREMIIPPPGHWLLAIDYSVLELRVLAQICLLRFGKSALTDLFRQGVDCHKYTAAALLGITLDQFHKLPKANQKQYRQAAKAVSFGAPGGLGPESLASLAKHSYGVDMSLEQAKKFRSILITEIYPELSSYLKEDKHQTIAGNLHTSTKAVKQQLPKYRQVNDAARMISGHAAAVDGDEYDPALIEFIWEKLSKLNQNVELTPALASRKPSMQLMRRIFYGNAETISGRIRGHISFSQRANTPFQGAAADGNKLALFHLLRAGFQCCAFIHDEILVAIPAGADYDLAVEQVDRILCDAMQQICPDIPIKTESLLADRWYKDVDEQPIDSSGQIVPYRQQQWIGEVTRRRRTLTQSDRMTGSAGNNFATIKRNRPMLRAPSGL